MEKQRFHSWFALFAVLALSGYQLFLCYLNTHGIGVNNNTVAAAEGGILLLVAFKVLFKKNLTELAAPAFIAAYFILLCVLRGEVDVQGMRNIFIIYAMFSLGRQTDPRDINRIVWALSAFAAIFCFFEYCLIDLYLSTFDVLHYYSARGKVSDEQLGYLNTNLWVSGMRPDGRTMLPFLGDQRVSSIFLEPVSLGNYAAIVVMWALSFDLADWRKSIGHFMAGAFFVIACDSRFASLIIIALTIIRFVPITQKPLMLYLLPIIIVGGQAWFASLHIVDSRMDDLPGRLAKAGDALLDMRLADVFGLTGVEQLLDMGIPYSLVVFGVLLCTFLWIRLTFLKFATPQGTRLRAMLAVYCLGLLMISGTSFYSSKTSGILWLMMGGLYAQRSQAKEVEANASPPEAQNATAP